MAQNPTTDGSGGYLPPQLNSQMLFEDYGSYGLRQYSGWVREEFLPQLVGRQAITVYREMIDNSSVVGSMLFAIQQAMRKVKWRVEPASDNAAAKKEADFADSLRMDMSHTWEDFVTEALSMLGYGFAAHEIVYKRRSGPRPPQVSDDTAGGMTPALPTSDFADGRIGWRRLPIRGQDTVLKWFFDGNGQVRGLTQQPWVGTFIDIPIEKMLLFRPQSHKNNPEGRSILRTAYRSYYFVKRMEEMEAVLFERISGFPLLTVPNALMDAAAGTGPDSAKASMTLQALKNLVTNVRIGEQMGAMLPSNTYQNADGTMSNVKMYDFQLLTPGSGGGKGGVDIDKTITRHKIDMLMTVLCDFIQMGHEVRGTNNLGTMKVDMFYAAIEGWLQSIASVLNRYALPRIWELNGLDLKLMPEFQPDMPQRMDLDGLGAFINNLAMSGMALFPDEELESFLRDAAGFPEVNEEENGKTKAVPVQMLGMDKDNLKKMLKGMMARRIKEMRQSGGS